MGRKLVLETYHLIKNHSLGASFTSDETSVKNLDGVYIELEWASGSSPIGEILIEVASSIKNTRNSTVWKALDFGSSILISGNSGGHAISLILVPFEKIRIRYVRTSGSATLNAYVTGKVVGA